MRESARGIYFSARAAGQQRAGWVVYRNITSHAAPRRTAVRPGVLDSYCDWQGGVSTVGLAVEGWTPVPSIFAAVASQVAVATGDRPPAPTVRTFVYWLLVRVARGDQAIDPVLFQALYENDLIDRYSRRLTMAGHQLRISLDRLE